MVAISLLPSSIYSPPRGQRDVLKVSSGHCHGCGVGCSYSSDLTPNLGTSICCRCGPKKKRRQKKKKKGSSALCECQAFAEDAPGASGAQRKATLLAKIWKALYSGAPACILSLIAPSHSNAPVLPVSLVWLQYKCSPASESLHMLFPLPGMLPPPPLFIQIG